MHPPLQIIENSSASAHYIPEAMHEYDIALKSILTRREGTILARLTGIEVAVWHNNELPEVRSQHADLLGETLDKTLVHVELQSTNDPRMAARMLEYAIGIHRAFDRFPEQLVLYVGEAPLRMTRGVSGPGLSFECAMIDIRELDGEPLLESRALEDNIIAVLARLTDKVSAVRQILGKIAESAADRRAGALTELMILAGLRSLAAVIKKEMERMPILNDIMDHEVFGPELRNAMALGREEGLQAGLQEGLQKGERRLILSLVADRFGPVPDWARERIERYTAPELEKLALRVLKARTLEDLLS